MPAQHHLLHRWGTTSEFPSELMFSTSTECIRWLFHEPHAPATTTVGIVSRSRLQFTSADFVGDIAGELLVLGALHFAVTAT
jgi:hypothetical protein